MRTATSKSVTLASLELIFPSFSITMSPWLIMSLLGGIEPPKSFLERKPIQNPVSVNNPAVDVWSIGLILAELLMRKPLLPGNDSKNEFSQPPTKSSWFSTLLDIRVIPIFLKSQTRKLESLFVRSLKRTRVPSFLRSWTMPALLRSIWCLKCWNSILIRELQLSRPWNTRILTNCMTRVTSQWRSGWMCSILNSRSLIFQF